LFARIILLLGSDDLATWSLLERTKLVVATTFQAEDTYCFIADQIEVYADNTYDIIVERYGDHDATIFIFDKRGTLVLLDDFSIANYFDASGEVYDYMVNWASRTGEDIPNMPLEIRPVEKMQILFRITSAAFILRNKEETNGEEIAGFVLGASKHAGKINLMVQEKIDLPQLIVSLAELHKVPVTNYSDGKDLFSKVLDSLRPFLVPCD
jgi:hypothetical protein